MPKRKKKKIGRPSKGPTVSVSLRLSKDLADRISALRKKVERTRTEIIESLIKAGFKLKSYE